MPTKIVFFGNERLATGVSTTAPVLQALLQAGYDVAAIVVNQVSVSRRNRVLEIESLAEAHNIPVLRPRRVSDIASELSEISADIGVLVAFGQLVPTSVINLFPNGIVNLHPSLLPLHRGTIPIESVILEGANETGVSIMQLTAQMDSGPVWAQTSIALDGHETKQALADRLSREGSQLLLATLPSVLAGTSVPQPQSGQPTIDGRLSKADGQIDWHKPAARIEREVRAYLGWPGSYTTIAGRDVIITAAHVVTSHTDVGNASMQGGLLTVGTSDGSLVIDRLKPSGKREMSASEFVLGVPELR